jgi:hypothetical protein
MTMKKYGIGIIFSLMSLWASAQGQLKVERLRCEYDSFPLGIETQHPRFSWVLSSLERSQEQSAYQILVSDNPELLAADKGNVWDSRKVNSAQSIQVEYAGSALKSSQKYFWKVKVWNRKGEASAWSQPASWQMGLLSKSDWSGAQWISLKELDMATYKGMNEKDILDKVKNIQPQFRKDFRISKSIKSATAFVSGLGHFDFFINGQKVGDHFLDPGWTTYEKYVLYVTFDITKQLQSGNNTLGIMLGNGFYTVPKGRYRKAQLVTLHGLPKTICKVLVEYTDGTSETVITDPSWKVTISPITFGNVYAGEDYDATLEHEGWTKPEFDATSWSNAVSAKGNDTLYSQRAAPLKVMEEFEPKSVFKTSKGWVYDMGQNMSGIPRITLSGPRGKTVKMYPAELLNADSTANQKATGSSFIFSYRLKGKGDETWQPQFTYYGYRYVMVEGATPEGQRGADTLPVIRKLTGLHTRLATPQMGSFECSNDLFNRTNTLIDWAVKSNMASVLTDCPHREKLGWLEQTYLMGTSLQYSYDIAAYYTKIMADMQSVQSEDGFLPEIAPEYCVFNTKEGTPSIFRDSPEWSSAYIILAWYMYQWYGDTRLMTEHYDGLKRLAKHIASKADSSGIVSYGLGDWYDLGPQRPGVAQLTTQGVTGTATWYYDMIILQKIATLLGKQAEAAEFGKQAEQIKANLNKRFFNPATGQYDKGSQTANAMALYLGIVEPAYRDVVMKNLLADIRSRNNALTAGDIGYRYLIQALQQGGASDVIFDMNNRSDVPGYGYQLAKGATALTESWQALPIVSNNHLMLGHLMEWFYSTLGGISQSEASVGYKQFVISPEPVGDVTSAKTTFISPYGPVKTNWKMNGKTFELNFEIPANTSALVYLPKGTPTSVTEGGKDVKSVIDLKFLRIENGRAVYFAGSGVYAMNVTY